MKLRRNREEKPPGRHARQAAAPPAAPAPPVPVPPVTLGAGARLTAGGPPGAGPVFTGLRTVPGGPTVAVIALGNGWEAEVSRMVWLDALAAAAGDARAVLERGARERRKAEINAGLTPRFRPAGPAAEPSGPPGTQERM